VRKFVPDGNPIGKTLRTSPEPNYPSTVYEIVGVIPDTKYNTLRSPSSPQVFAPDAQLPRDARWPGTNMMIHSTLGHAATMASVKRRIADSHPGTVVEFLDFQAQVRAGLVRERLLAVLAGFFGLLAALLAMVGLYGMISFATTQRRHEIGIRVALGAHRPRVIAMVMREAAWLLLPGLVVGAVVSRATGQGAATLLFGLEPHDPFTLAAACAILTVIAAAASFVPARSASRLDPLAALRQE
jgi:ABC-type lipoprotein release transport system permease subunit